MFSSNVSPCLKEKREQGGEGCLKRTGERVCTHREGEREINSGREDNRCRTGVCMQKCWFPFFYCSRGGQGALSHFSLLALFFFGFILAAFNKSNH